MKKAVFAFGTCLLIVAGAVAILQTESCNGLTKIPAKVGQSLFEIEQAEDRRQVEQGQAETLRQLNDPEYRAAKIKEIERQEEERNRGNKNSK